MHDERMYPPHITITAHSQTHQWATITLAVTGMKIKETEDCTETLFQIPEQFGSLTTRVPKVVAVADEPLLQMKPHFNILYTTLCKSVAPQWGHFGGYLGVEPFIIDRIKENDKDVYACFRELIKEWLRQINPPATKSKIIQVLRELKFNAEADKLEEIL